MKKLKGVLFDLDGLMVDTEPLSYEIYSQILEEFHQEMTIQEYLEHYSGKTEAANVQTLIEEYSLPSSCDELLAKVEAAEKELVSKGVPLKPGMIRLLDWLDAAGIRKGLATSSSEERARTLLVPFSCWTGLIHGPQPVKFKNQNRMGKFSAKQQQALDFQKNPAWSSRTVKTAFGQLFMPKFLSFVFLI
ncbi:MAG: HAD family phosphatase [Erysipelotrichaceae bacterium]|nr:HAD family phosphatase [Erysipelotrichaceae bacterium]